MFRFADLALKDLRHYHGRSALAISGVAVIVSVYFTLAGLAEGLGKIAGAAGSARNLMLLDKQSIFLDDAAIAPEAIEAARGVPGVSDVVPMLYRHVRVEDGIVHLRATPLESYRVAHTPSLVTGEWLESNEPAHKAAGRVMVGEGLARLRDWEVGQSLDIAGESMTIVGLFQAEGFKNSEIWVSLEDGVRLLGRPDSYSLALALISPEADANSVREALANRSEQNVVFEHSYFEQVNQAMKQVRDVVLMVSTVALLAIVFGVFNLVSMIAAERRREVGLLRACGVGMRDVVGIFLLQGLAVSSVGFLVGLALGGAIVVLLGATSAVNLADVAIQPKLTPSTILSGGAITLALGLAGGYLPARSAAKVSVARALGGI